MNKSINILIVDDDTLFITLLSVILVHEGYAVHSANSGPAALQLLQGQPIDILLTDYSMPGMNGVELIRETRKTHPNLLNFIITAYSDEYICKHGPVEGLQKVIAKPLDIASLRSTLSGIITANLVQYDTPA
jgi:two-component system response regulator YesN